MKHYFKFMLLFFIMCIIGAKAMAYDFSADNSDGVTIYYNFINDKKELEVTFGYYLSYKSGTVEIPSEVLYNGITYSVTSIGSGAFSNCSGLTSVTIPYSVTFYR